MAAEGHPDPDDAISKVIKEAEEVWKPFIQPEVRRKRHGSDRKSRGSSTSDEESTGSESEETGNEKSEDEDDKPLDEQIRKRSAEVNQGHETNQVQSSNQDQSRVHTSDEDDHDGMEMETDDVINRAPIRLPGMTHHYYDSSLSEK